MKRFSCQRHARLAVRSSGRESKSSLSMWKRGSTMNAHLERAEAPDTTLIFSVFLTSAWHKMAQAMTEYTERCLGIPSLLLHGCLLDDFASANVDAGFMD